ncbi:methenyltetrahydromethanopterin cyclohydrolase [Salinarchaeum laminariae]|uniref:methenyltetrahydromethanopterin cyclohydrolase n=1 Tax=Salinarchaeum laminariae TaxID=869888 RepID=UPI0020C110AD|nr:methenyltetrahydromethanopterin cyclohydrolase [Salinarchaeum laminariae]
MESLNRTALELVDEALEFAEELDVGARELANGATVLDFGVEFTGGLEAGMLLAEIQSAGLATVQSRIEELDGTPISHVELTTDQPGLALLGAQKTGWEVSVDEYEALGSGPARALVAEETIFDRLGYTDVSEFAVLALESEALPTADVAEHVAERSNVEAGSVFLPTYPTASLAGSVTVAARAPELAAFRLAELGYDPTKIVSASGVAPVAPVAGDEETALARTNDALAYGGQVHLVVEDDFDRFDEIPSSAGEEYGEPFYDIFDAADWDFYDLPEDVFAPAQVTIDVLEGPTYALGERDEELVAESFGL